VNSTMSASPVPFNSLPPVELERLAVHFPERVVALGDGVWVSVREHGEGCGLPLVCLHGIGSGSASWLETALRLSRRTRVIAWDAPGYGASTPLPMDAPRGTDYAQRLYALLDVLDVPRCVLVGHSLGALMAVPAIHAIQHSQRFAALALISPAQGYGATTSAGDGERVRAERLQALAELGIAGMAELRSARLVSEHASPQARAWVRWNMGRLHERGYRQAVELLCGSDLLAQLPVPIPIHVACGALDVITTPAACAEVAQAAGAVLHPIALAGHACYVEQPDAVAQWLAGVLDAAMGAERVGMQKRP